MLQPKIGLGTANKLYMVAAQTRTSPAHDKYLSNAATVLHGARTDYNARRAIVMDTAMDNYRKHMDTVYSDRADVAAMDKDARLAYRQAAALAAEMDAKQAAAAAGDLLTAAQTALATVKSGEPKMVYCGRTVSAVNMIAKRDKLARKYAAQTARYDAMMQAAADAHATLARLQAAAQTAASQAAAALATAAAYPNYTWQAAAHAAANAWDAYYHQLGTVSRYYGTAHAAAAALVKADMDATAAALARVDALISGYDANVRDYKKAMKNAQNAVKAAKNALDEAQDNEKTAHITAIGYSAESWDIYALALINPDYAAAYLRMCKIIAYQAVKARVISATAAIARSRAVNDTTKNHREAFYEKACNAGCDKRLIDILGAFSGHGDTNKADNIVSAVYTGLAQCYDKVVDNPRLASTPMFLAGMRLAWKEIERERGARVKVGDTRQRIINAPLTAADAIPDTAANFGASRPTGLYRSVEVEVENRIFESEIRCFIRVNSEILAKNEIDLLQSIQGGVSIRQYAETIGKDKKIVQRMVDNIQRKLSKVDKSEHGANRRVSTFMNFLDYYSRTNRYA